MRPAILAWAPVLLVALGMGSAWHLDDHGVEQAVADDLELAQAQAAATLRRDLAAARLCRQQHGEAAYTWAADGALVCIPRRGPRTVAQAQGQP